MELWGIFGGFFEGDFEKIPHQKPCIFKASGGFWGIGELFLYIYMKCFYNIYKDYEKKPPIPHFWCFESFQIALVDKLLINKQKKSFLGFWKIEHFRCKRKRKYPIRKELGTLLLVAETGLEPATSGL